MIYKIRNTMLSKEFIIFFFGGVSAFFLDFFLLNFLVYALNFNPLLFNFISVANLISTTTAVVYNFFIQKFFAFKTDKQANAKIELSKFVGVQVFNIFFFGGLVFGIFLNLNLSVPIAKIFTTCFQMISSYFLYKFFVFKKKIL